MSRFRSRNFCTHLSLAIAAALAFAPTAFAQDDSTTSTTATPGKRFAVGVLWHPEEGEDAALFRALVDEARAYREAD